MKDIRTCSGFDDFLRSPKFSGLLPALEALDGPVVFINIHRFSCDAVILYQDHSTDHTQLPSLSERKAIQLRSLWVRNLDRSHARVRRAAASPDMVAARGAASVLRRILERLWSWVVVPILERLNFVSIVFD